MTNTSCTINIIPADALAAKAGRASAGKVLTYATKIYSDFWA